MSTKKQKGRKGGVFTPEFRQEIVKLHLEEGYSIVMLSEEFGCGKSTISGWVKKYNEHGEAGFQNRYTNKKKSAKTVNTALKSQIIVSIRRPHVSKISDLCYAVICKTQKGGQRHENQQSKVAGIGK